MPDLLNQEERHLLLEIARQSVQAVVCNDLLPEIDLDRLPHHLREEGVVFVTLTVKNELRGCIGSLEPYQPLAMDVREHAIAAAQNDYRFAPIKPDELDDLCIEISRLTPPIPLNYASPDELVNRLRPFLDGVILKDGSHKATFLPQVWEKVSEPARFLSYLCQKMGAPEDQWRKKSLDVYTYQVEEFHEVSTPSQE